jgi:hypothetical protein
MYHLTTQVSGDLTKKVRYIDSVELREAAATPGAANCVLRNGTATGDRMRTIPLAASGTYRETFDPPLYVPDGLFVSTGGGAWAATVHGH